MARTAPFADWSETASGERVAGSGEWDALRNELASLIDQVETRLKSHAEHAPAQPAVQERHSNALQSVRRAMDRQAARELDSPPAPSESVFTRSEEIADAIGKIRARQGVKPTLGGRDRRSPAEDRRPGATRQTMQRSAGYADAPAEHDPQALVGMHRALRDIGSRMERFEQRFSHQIADLGSNRDVAAQVSQLAEVVELLAGAIGDRAPMKRVEAQIAELSRAVATAPASEDAAILTRLDGLSRLLEDVTGHQHEIGARQDAASRYADATMRFVEDSVRGIYDKIDALEAAHAATPKDIEKLTTDLAALSRALEARDSRAQDELAERFNTLQRRIDTMALQLPEDGTGLSGAVSELRAVVLDSLEPRFTALEDKIDGLSAGGADAAAPNAEITTQLRSIHERIEATGLQIEALMQMARTASAPDEAPDYTALADMVAERTRAQMPETAGRSDVDIDALEERLSRLFVDNQAVAPDTAPIDRLGETIASVDSRLAQIEATLNAQKAAAAAPRPITKPVVDETMALSLAPAPAFVRPDTMPQSPDGEEPLRQRATAPTGHIPDPQTLALDARAAEPVESFSLDPESIARPEKPVSSFDAAEPAVAARVEPSAPAVADDDLRSAVNRANFIEAARRAARNTEPESEQPSRSLIGRALARFQTSEAQARTETAETIQPEPAPIAAPQPEIEAVSTDDAMLGEDRPESFVRRHRRALLIGTALVVALLLTANLVSQRLLSGPDAAPTPPAAAVTAPEPTVETPAPAETLDAPAVETPAVETPAAAPAVEALPDAAALPVTAPRIVSADTAPSTEMAFAPGAGELDAGLLDPVTTASTGSDALTALAPDMALGDSPMPVAVIPEGIGPDDLRAAAEGGDMYAQFEVAAILTEGHVVEQDLAQAAAWYERSAAQGFAPAQYRLGNLYESGQGVEQDLEQARLWYQRAAETGNRMSMHNLASLYAGGQLETQDFAAAAHWFEEAAARGMTDSQFNLGMLFARGLGIDQSFSDSYVWFSLAAQSGDADAAQARDDVARSIDPATLQTLDAQIAAWEPMTIAMPANFAPIGTWNESFDAGAAITNQEVVLRVQELLGKLGYEIGTPDGLVGPMTREAIATFERETGMNETGAVNPRLLAVLGSQPV